VTARVLVLGGQGMLGSAIARRVQGLDSVAVTATGRTPGAASGLAPFVVGAHGLEDLVAGFGDGDYVINCIGLTKHKMRDDVPKDRLAAVRVNAELPYQLAELADLSGFRVIQIATDCVYSGIRGGYDELDEHDPLDVYGKTKSLGEVPQDGFLNVRCSIIGREIHGRTSLVEWLLSQPDGTTVNGFTDHRWNGVTTAAFADLVAGIVQTRSQRSGTVHFLPADVVDKHQLLGLIRDRFGRDLKVVATESGSAIDRTLTTRFPEVNRELWALAGHTSAPSISALVGAMPG